MERLLQLYEIHAKVVATRSPEGKAWPDICYKLVINAFYVAAFFMLYVT